MAVGLPQCGHSNQLMFSTIPRTGTPTRWNILTPRRASPVDISCGVVTITAPWIIVARARRHINDEVIELSPSHVAQELRDDLHHDRTAPNRRLILVDQESQ